jgi:hypothetical protein
VRLARRQSLAFWLVFGGCFLSLLQLHWLHDIQRSLVMNTNTPLQELVHEIERLPPDAVVGLLGFVRSLRIVPGHPAANGSTMSEPRAKLLDYAGVLRDSTHWNEHPLDIQEQMRDEWA